MDPKAIIYSVSAVSAALAVFTGIGAGIQTAKATGKAVEAVSRQPEAKNEILTTLMVGCGFSEATAIYGLLVAILLIVVKIA